MSMQDGQQSCQFGSSNSIKKVGSGKTMPCRAGLSFLGL